MLKKLTLQNNHIDEIADLVQSFLAEHKVEQKNILRLRLAIEDLLLDYQTTLGSEASVQLKLVKRLRRIYVELSIVGERFDPFTRDVDDELGDGAIMRSLLNGLGIAPIWQYKNGVNVVSFTAKKKQIAQPVQLGIAILMALLCGGLCYLLPDTVRIFINTQLVMPLFNTFMGLLTAIAGPMIFLSVAWGIYSIGDTATLGRIGKRMISRYLLMTLLIATLTMLVFMPFFQITTSGDVSFRFSDLLNMVLNIIPNNFFTPFTEGNPLQIIFVAVLLGLSMVVLGNKTTVAATFVEQANYIVQLIMEVISSLIPLFVFGSIWSMILSNNFAVLLESYKLLPLLFLGCIIAMIVYLCLVCTRKKVSPVLILKKTMPTFLIGLTTASSAAAFATNVECCEKQLGIDKRIINFAIPLGQVVFMPGAAILFLAAGFCMAEVYQVPMSITWMLTALIITVILAVAAPPVPGGALTCYTMLFVQLNIPAEAIAVTIALNVVLEFVATAINLFCLQLELVELSGGLDMLDEDVLRRAIS